MVKASTIIVVFILAISKEWIIRQLDVNNAFLNRDLQDDVYIAQPEGIINRNKLYLVCKLNKALYRLKHAPRAWFIKLSNYLMQWGFKCSNSNTSILHYNTKVDMIIFLIYIDDIVVIGTNLSLIWSIVSKLNEDFNLKSLGELIFILELQVTKTDEEFNLF